jgi:acyl-CoA thioesterase-2
MRPGDPSIPIIYEVDRIRDGRSFTTRRIVAIQHGQAIFSMSCSFHVTEDDVFDHQSTMPDVPPPEALADESDMKATFMQVAPEPIRKYWERERPLELRPTSFEHYTSDEPQPAEQFVWIRSTAPVPAPFADDPRVHAAILAYASDMTLLDTALFPTVCRSSRAPSKQQASTTPCGFTGPSGSKTGCSTRKTPLRRTARAVLRAARSTIVLANWSPPPCKRG